MYIKRTEVLKYIISILSNIIFFFSSRRRHTRLTCDWSSDVCSSDLWRTLPSGIWSHTTVRKDKQDIFPDPNLISMLRSEEHTSELQSHVNLVCRLLLEKKKK